MKIHLHDAGHMAKMAAMPIYGKILITLIIFFPETVGQIPIKLGMKHLGLFKLRLWVDLNLFYGKVKFCN